MTETLANNVSEISSSSKIQGQFDSDSYAEVSSQLKENNEKDSLKYENIKEDSKYDPDSYAEVSSQLKENNEKDSLKYGNIKEDSKLEEKQEKLTEESESKDKINTIEKKDNIESESKERMEPPITIKFKCPESCDPKEFERQLKGQERGLNSQTIEENTKNREAYEKRKTETGNGRDVESGKAQEITRQKAYQSRIESNQRKGMSYSEAKAEADSWIKTQAALHNPDQIAGGDPKKVSRMGDSNVNSSIGSQWRSRVNELDKAINEYSEGKSPEELKNTKLNVKLEME